MGLPCEADVSVCNSFDVCTLSASEPLSLEFCPEVGKAGEAGSTNSAFRSGTGPDRLKLPNPPRQSLAYGACPASLPGIRDGGIHAFLTAAATVWPAGSIGSVLKAPPPASPG